MKGFSAVLVALLAAVLVSGCTATPPADPGGGDPGVGNGDGTATMTYTLADVAQHDSADDCWMALDGEVYDFTPFIASASHPGGAAILEGCGKDGTSLFETRPMGSGTPHSQGARDLHAQYLIGELAR